MVERRTLRMLAVAGACLAATLVGGCGSDSSEPTATSSATDAPTSEAPTSEAAGDLDAYVENARAQLPQMWNAAMRKTFSAIEVDSAPPNGVEFTYVFKKAIASDQVSEYFESQVPLLDAAFSTQMEVDMEAAGIDEPSVTWTYENPDGTEIWSHTTSSESSESSASEPAA